MVVEEDGDAMDSEGDDSGQASENEGGGVVDAGQFAVTYTNDGFAPSALTIPVGSSVSFLNNSNRNFWPASAQHPTHRVYPEQTDDDCSGSSFDACQSIPSNQSWSFTFNEVGEWGYHDHLSPGKFGVIRVQ